MNKILLFLLAAVNVFALSWDQNISKGVLQNGLQYFVRENKFPANSASFYLVVGSGSIDESSDERGLAHFIEHMAFNGSRDFSKNELIEKLEGLGVKFGADLNAQTGYDSTIYALNIAVSEENLKDVFKIFSSWIDGVQFDADELQKERGVIIEEQRLRDTPAVRLYERLSEQLFEGSAYMNRAPIGDMSVVKSVDAQRLKELYHKIYQPRFMKFIAVGDFNRTQILNLIDRSFRVAANTNSYAHPSKEIPLKRGTSIYNYDSNETGTKAVRINYFDEYEPLTDEKSARKILIHSMIENLFRMLYERKNAHESFVSRADFSRSHLQFQRTVFGFEGKVYGGDLGAALRDMSGVMKGLARYGFNKSDFKRLKKSLIGAQEDGFALAKTKNSRARAQEILIASQSGATLLSDEEARSLNVRLLKEISLGEVNAEFRRILNLKDRRISVFDPEGRGLRPAEFNELQSKAVPYIDRADEEEPGLLIDGSIAAGAIVSKEYDEKHKFYLYLLENNATVILKPLQSRKNFISFAAVSKGGASNLADPKLAGFAARLSNESGAGRFSGYELSKILSDRRVSYGKNIDSISHGFYGSCSTQDVEFLLQAINVEFNSPRMDERALQRIKTKASEELSMSERSPRYKFSAEFVDFFYDNNPRMKRMQKSDIEALRLQPLKKIINDKFSNAASFVFVFSGDFDVLQLEPLLQKYIAALPSKPHAEEFVDDGVRSISGRHKFERAYQSSQRSDVSVTIVNKNVPCSQANKIKIKALAYILQTMLREQIREQNAQSYGFSVDSSVGRIPYSRSSVGISFSCAPKNTDEILIQIKQITQRIKDGEASVSRYLQNFKKAQILSARKNYDLPGTWSSNLISHKLYGDEILTPSEYESIVNSISEKDVKEAARIYLNDENEVVRINGPAVRDE